MRFTDVFIKRPVLACTVSLLILLIGAISLSKLNIREFPKVQFPVVSIAIPFPGASPEVMEGFVTTPVENAISSIDGIDYIGSNSVQGYTEIHVHMKLNYSTDQAAIDIENKIAAIRGNLPKEIQDPIVHKSNPDAEAIMYLSFASDALSPEKLSDYLVRTVQPIIQSQTGVSDATLFGGHEYAMRIWLDPFLMAAHQVT